MSTAPQTDLRFPIGAFIAPQAITSGDRARWIEPIASMPAKLRAAIAGLSDAQLQTPYRPGGWTVRQVVHHYADSHMNAFCRTKLALTETNPTIKPYDESAWAMSADYELPIELSLGIVEGVHARWVALLRSLRPD